MTDLAAWLIDAIAADERVARAVMDWHEAPIAHNLPWHTTPGDPRVIAWGLTCVAAASDRVVSEFIARHDPARVLAECAAKRAVVERYVYLADHGDSGDARWVLAALAQPYRDREGWRDEWATADPWTQEKPRPIP